MTLLSFIHLFFFRIFLPCFSWVLLITAFCACQPDSSVKSNVKQDKNSSSSSNNSSPFSSSPFDQALKNGQRNFRKCQVCHTLNKQGTHRAGPNLYHLFNRRIGSLEDFPYSKRLREENFIWTEEKLDKWLENPKTFLPGNRMLFIGIKNKKDRQDLILFLKQKTKPDPKNVHP